MFSDLMIEGFKDAGLIYYRGRSKAAITSGVNLLLLPLTSDLKTGFSECGKCFWRKRKLF